MNGIPVTSQLIGAVQQDRVRAATRARTARRARHASRAADPSGSTPGAYPPSAWSSLLVAIRVRAA